MLQEFKKFAMRGNVVDLAIGVIIGGAVGTTLIVLIGLFGPDGWLSAAQDGGFASNGYGTASPGGFGLGAAIVAEILLTGITGTRLGLPAYWAWMGFSYVVSAVLTSSIEIP